MSKKVPKYPTLKWPGNFGYFQDYGNSYLEVPLRIIRLLELQRKISKKSRRDHQDVYLAKGKDLNIFISAYLHYFRFKMDKLHKSLFWRECVVNSEDDKFMDDLDDYYV